MNIGNGIGSAGLISTIASSAAAETDALKQASQNQELTAAPVKVDATTLTSASSVILRGLSAPDGRESQVQAIQAAIAAGTYHVPASAVADKLIQAMLG